MLKPTVNLGILAHIDAGKTSLTERLLFDNGVTAELGSVDAGNTQTDTNELERERGITIRSAVASFHTRDLQINLVDTPGHPDFIAEVERALSVLDGAVLVLSAVEGVQAQTRVLMKSLRKLRMPTLIFVNKIDRRGARYGTLLTDIRQKLAPNILAMSTVQDVGTPEARSVARSLDRADFRDQAAEVLSESDDALLARLVEGSAPSAWELRDLMADQCAAGQLHPVFFGSALIGQGVAELTRGVEKLLRPSGGAAADALPARGTVFAVERTGSGEKVALLRMFSGEVRERQRLTFWRRESGGVIREITGKVAALEVIGADGMEESGRPPEPAAGDPSRVHTRSGRLLASGSIGRLRGLPRIRVGDRLGGMDDAGEQLHFSPPSLETVVRARQPGQEARLHAALTSLADEDPLIQTRAAGDGATAVLLYGAVQQEVIAARLERDFGVEATFEPIQPVYFERPRTVGTSLTEFDLRGTNDFWATVGLKVEPAEVGSGVHFTREVEWGAMPRAFHRAIEEAALRTLHQGLQGWEVTDCAVTVTHIGYCAPISVAADFRNLTPVVLMRALQDAGTLVVEPCQALEVEVPEDVLNAVVGQLVALGADIERVDEAGTSWLITGSIPVRQAQEFALALPGLSRGEGAVWSRPGPDRPVRGEAPTRRRFDGNPLSYVEYLRFLSDRSLGSTTAAPSR